MGKSDKESPGGDPVLIEYAELAAQYDSRWSFYIEATVRETLSRLEIRATERLLDVGCGTGALLAALSLAAPSLEMTGVDPSPEMLGIAREKLGPSAHLAEGRAESLPFADEAFHVVVSTNALHYVRQPRQALSEMARVLKPGGRLVITDWCDDYLACRLCDLWLRLFGRAHYRMYGSKACRQMLEASKFETVGVERYKINWLWGLMTAMARKV